jgi:hypothetical protein
MYESHRCASYRDVRTSLAGREYDRRVSYRGVHLIGVHLIGLHLLQACISWARIS